MLKPMMQCLFRGALVAILGVVGSLQPAEAAVKIGDDKTFLNISPYVQFFYEHRDGRAPDGSALNDFRLRRTRLWLDGQIGSPFITFAFQLGHDGFETQSANSTAVTETASTQADGNNARILDANMTLGFHDAFKLTLGQQYWAMGREWNSYANSR